MQRRSVHDAIQWHEGMLLLPQHFQQMDRRIEHLLSYHLHTTLPYAWGIIDFQYDTAAALSGRIYVHNLEAIMPDGSIVSANTQQANSLSLDLKPFMATLQQKVMTLYVTMVPYQWDKGNATSENPRFYSVDSATVVDENTGENTVAIPMLKPNITLRLAESEPLGVVALPLLKIQRLENVYHILEYFPPQLKISRDSSIGTLCGALSQRIREKIIFLRDRMSSQTSDIVSTDTEKIIAALGGGLLSLEAMTMAGVSHPFHLYLQLIQTISQMMIVAPGTAPPLLNVYHHNNLRSSFQEVLAVAHGLLDRIQEGYHVVPFSLIDRIFSLPLVPQWQTSHLVVGAKAPTNMSEKEVASWISQAVIATDDRADDCRARRILGANRHFVTSTDEAKLMAARDVVLFEIEYDERFIDFSKVLQIFNVADMPDSRPEELVLYLPKRDQFQNNGLSQAVKG